MFRYRAEMPFGAALLDDLRGVRFRLYAPNAASVALFYERDAGERVVALERDGDGFFEYVAADAGAGTRYGYEIDGARVPDPASRYNPDGVHGSSVVVDPHAFRWPDDGWAGRPWHEHVLYEIHVGTFSPQGTYRGAIEKLDALVELGVTAVELMPIADVPGSRNWGYDGVLLYAPSHNYGTPDDLKAFVVAAHARKLCVFLDVVYNHFGPEANFLHQYASDFYTEEHHTPWGAAIDVEPDDREIVRAFFYENAVYWLQEYRFDGLRLDAIDTIHDGPERRFLREFAGIVRARVTDRTVHLTTENDRNEASLLEDGFTAQWNDDEHHAAHVIVTGEQDGYYADYLDDPIDMLGRALTSGYVYQGQHSPLRGATRGESSGHLPLTSFVDFLQNHDQIGNRPFGKRLSELAAPQTLRAMLAVVLLAPSIPLLFMGEEWAASSPFLFFCDFEPELAKKVTEGRRNEFRRFEAFADPRAAAAIPDPNALETFELSKLDWSERSEPSHASWLAYYRSLLEARRRWIVPRIEGLRGTRASYRRVGGCALEARFDCPDGRALALAANLCSSTQEALRFDDGGETIFEIHDAPRTPAPPWSVRWSLR